MTPIPRILHYVWVGPKPFPPDAERNLARWRALLPDFEFRRWTEDNLPSTADFVRKAYVVGAMNRVANYVRLAALHQHGGIYLDHDVELLKPLHPFLGEPCFFGYQTARRDGAKDLVNTAVIGAAPGHRFIGRMLTALDQGPDGATEVSSDSGPGLVTRLLREEGLPEPGADVVRLPDVTLFPARVFYPYEWNEDFHPSCITPDTAAVHRWAHLWKLDEKLPKRARRKLLRALARTAPDLAFDVIKSLNGRRRAAVA